MRSKKVSAIAAAALLFASSTAVAQTAPRSLGSFGTSAALLQSEVVEEDDDDRMAPYTGPLIGLVLLAFAIFVANTGDDDETVSPN